MKLKNVSELPEHLKVRVAAFTLSDTVADLKQIAMDLYNAGHDAATNQGDDVERNDSPEKVLDYTTRLATWMARNIYPEIETWAPATDIIGVLAQIDNMLEGLERKDKNYLSPRRHYLKHSAIRLEESILNAHRLAVQINNLKLRQFSLSVVEALSEVRKAIREETAEKPFQSAEEFVRKMGL